jgi:RNA polymerase sigma-70 factor, ECF subfamily
MSTMKLGHSRPVDPTASDHTLLRRLRAGEDDAAAQLYLRYARRLHGLARKQTSSDLARQVDPEDIVQSVFRTFFRRASAGDYETPAGEELWRLLLVITLNKIRRKAIYYFAECRDLRRTASADDLGIGRYFSDPACDHESALSLLKIVIDGLIERFPVSKRTMIHMRVDGFEIEEIAAATKRSKRTIERTLQTFRALLRHSLEESPARE